MSKLTIAFITYNDLTAKYLPYFLPSLKIQSFQNFNILVADNSESENNENKDYIKNNYPDIDFEWSGENIGFAKAYNRLIEKAKQSGVEYFMVINPDVILEKNTILELIEAIDKDEQLGSVCPKILSWDFANNKKTNIIDSRGLVMPKPLRFVDFMQGEKSKDNIDNKNIIGPSGACGLFRMNVLETIKEKYGYFDSRMFMYKEDCDLAYRLFITNFKTKCVTSSMVYHDRTVSKQKGFFEGREAKTRKQKEWSFANQQLIFQKHWKKQSVSAKISIFYYQIKVFIYILIFERYLLRYLFKKQ